MTYKIMAYSGTYRIKDDLKARGFVWDKEDGGSWVKNHVSEEQLSQYRALERGAWSGIVFTVTEEQLYKKNEVIPDLEYNPDKFVEPEVEDII